MGEEAIEAEVWRLESNEWADLGHPEKLKPKHKEAKAKNPLFISNPSRVSGIGDNRYWNLRIWIPGTLPKSVQFPHTSRKLRFVPGHGKQRISRLGMPGWMPCWKGRGDEMNSCIQDAKTFTPPPQNAGSQASTLRAGDWKGFLWGIWPAQEERLEDTDVRVSPTKQLISIQESHSQQVPSPTKSFQWAFGPLLLHSSWPPRIITYMRKVTNM